MPVITIKDGESRLKLTAVDKTTIKRMEALLGDLTHPSSPVSNQAEGVRESLERLATILDKPASDKMPVV